MEVRVGHVCEKMNHTLGILFCHVTFLNISISSLERLRRSLLYSSFDKKLTIPMAKKIAAEDFLFLALVSLTNNR